MRVLWQHMSRDTHLECCDRSSAHALHCSCAFINLCGVGMLLVGNTSRAAMGAACVLRF